MPDLILEFDDTTIDFLKAGGVVELGNVSGCRIAMRRVGVKGNVVKDGAKKPDAAHPMTEVGAPKEERKP